MKHASSLPLAIAICLSLAPFARGQIAGGTVDPSTIQPFTSGNGATNAGGPSGPGVSAVAHVNHPETQELIYGFQINYNGPLPAPSATTIDISGMIGGFALPGDNAQAEVEFGALANVGGSAGFAGSPLVTANGVANSTVTTFSQSFGQSYNVFVGQSYAVELYTSADIIAGTAGAFVDRKLHLISTSPTPPITASSSRQESPRVRSFPGRPLCLSPRLMSLPLYCYYLWRGWHCVVSRLKPSLASASKVAQAVGRSQNAFLESYSGRGIRTSTRNRSA